MQRQMPQIQYTVRADASIRTDATTFKRRKRIEKYIQYNPLVNIYITQPEVSETSIRDALSPKVVIEIRLLPPLLHTYQ